MGMELLGADFTPEQVKDGTAMESIVVPEVDPKIKRGQKLEPTKFTSVDASNGVKGKAKEENLVGNANFPKDSVGERPAPEKIHRFYFVKYRFYDEPKIEEQIKKANQDFEKKSKERSDIIGTLKKKRSERSQVISELQPLTAEDKTFGKKLIDKRKELEPYQEALGKLCDVNSAGAGLCSSEEELDDIIQRLHYCIQHESNTLAEEKQLLKQIKQLEGTRDKIIANSAVKATVEESFGEKPAIRDHLKLKFDDLDVVRKEQQVVRNKIKLAQDKLKAIDDEISSKQEELTSATEQKEKAYETCCQLRGRRDKANASYFQNRSVLNSAREHAAKKDRLALEELSHSEVEKFMFQWSSSKTFRDNYEKRILVSLDSRQLSRDGRMRNPDEKPIFSEASTATVSEVVPAKATMKREMDLKSYPLDDIISNRKDPKEDITKSTELDLRGKVGGTSDNKNTFGVEKLEKEDAKSNEIDSAKLKEIKREEEIAKAKLALDRKKKLAEKAAAKTAIRAQKEAEKKLKEKEKRAKRKAGASVPPPATELVSEVVEWEEGDLSTAVPPLEKNKEKKEGVVSYRNQPKKVEEQIPKIILRKKKSHSHWIWTAPAIVLVLVLAISVFYFSFGKN